MNKLFKFIIFVVFCSALSVNAQNFKHPHVRIYTEGVIKQNIKLSEKEWNAIILAVDYSLVRVQAALDALDEDAYSEAIEDINSALHLLTLVKIATPTFMLHEQRGSDDISVREIQSLNIVSYDAHGEQRIIDVPLLKAFLENARAALELRMINHVRLFLLNALESAIHEG